ncbi:MAG TPA: hypothetical protein VES19_00905 [Candidatus Limnocylindrales bacterium]|nr:hypothetical protein [Candidatus Limnocylindrales bacterium]
MTTTCPWCRTTVAIDAAGNSACGHLRSTPQPAPPPMYPQPAPPPVYPQPAPPPVYPQPAPPAWGYAPTPPRTGRSGCFKGCGCVLVLGLIGLVVLVVLAILADGELTFEFGGTDGSSIPSARPALTGTVTRGEEMQVGSGTSDPGSETTLTVPEGGPASGVQLVIPGDAYKSTTSFTLSAAPIVIDGFGGLVAPASELITVENGGAYSESPILVTVPVAIPDGSFAMGVYLRDDGTLEPMPLIDETPTSITIATRHFSSFFITVIAEAALPEDIGTGFRAGDDDIQAPNYGSYIESGGHCAGQSLAALWYFSERKTAGGPQLNGLLGNTGRDETPGFWQDDRLAYRLSSSISRDLRWSTLTGKIELAFEKAKVDRLQWNVFRYAMLLTGQPQFVGLSEGDDPGGHVIVAYAATETGLWVADPNFPGKLRDIRWKADKAQFNSYLSGANAEDSEHAYDKIAFYGKTALVDWAWIGRRWAQADAGYPGGDRFPGSSLNVAVLQADGTAVWKPLADGTIIPEPAIRIGFKGEMGVTMQVTVYRGETALADIASGADDVIALNPGVNRLGFYIQGLVDADYEAVDFVYINVIGPGASASPSEDPATPEPSAEPAVTPDPEPTFDCNTTPPPGGIKEMEWFVKCGDAVFGTAPP